MNNIVSIFGKGGAGKSTTAFLLVDFFSRMKNVNVLLIDLDKQNTISSALLGREKVKEKKSNSECFTSYIKCFEYNKNCDISEYLHTSKETGVDVMFVNGDRTLGVENYLKPDDVVSIVNNLKKTLTEKYDFIIVDTPPNIDSRNTIPIIGHLLSDLIITPVELSDFDIDALHDVFKTMNDISNTYKKYFNLDIGVLINKVYRNDTCEEKIKSIEKLAKENSAFIFSETIPYSSILKIQPLGEKKISTKKRYGKIYSRIHRFIVEIPAKIKLILVQKDSVIYATGNTHNVDTSFIDSYLAEKCNICGCRAIRGDNVCYRHSKY